MSANTCGNFQRPEKITVWLIDDSEHFRNAFIAGISGHPKFARPQSFPSTEALLSILHPESNLPHAILIDIEMPGIDGICSIPLVRKLIPTVQIIMLTCHGDEQKIRLAMGAGASGFLLKPSCPLEIENAVRASMSGLTPMSPAAIRRLAVGESAGGLEAVLTKRELQVYELVAVGMSRKDIAQRLFVSPDTVHFHTQNIFAKLHIHNRADIIRNVPTSASPDTNFRTCKKQNHPFG